MNSSTKIIMLLILTTLLLSACSSSIRKLETFKENAAQGRWQDIANEGIDCKAEQEGCNQLHLIKGDACYRLAKQNTDTVKNYHCAAGELELGIRQTADWSAAEAVIGRRGQYYENWCEALRLLRSEQTSNAAATPVNQKLLACAREFLQAPGELRPAATFFLHNAELAAIRFRIDNDPGSCQALQQLQQDENAAAQQAIQSRYADNHQRLLNDITGIKASLPGCP